MTRPTIAATAHDMWYELVHAHELSWDEPDRTLYDGLRPSAFRTATGVRTATSSRDARANRKTHRRACWTERVRGK